jgi:YHS domain-containing protein
MYCVQECDDAVWGFVDEVFRHPFCWFDRFNWRIPIQNSIPKGHTLRYHRCKPLYLQGILAILVLEGMLSTCMALPPCPPKCPEPAVPCPPANPLVPVPPPPPGEGAPVFVPPQLQGSLCDFLLAMPIAEMKAKAALDPLQRPPFAGGSIKEPKGLAAQIKAIELDQAYRIQAIRYLGTVDCVAFPEAQAVLVKTMLEDPFEEVRYEAVLALSIMLARGSDLESIEQQLRNQCDPCSAEQLKKRAAAIKKAQNLAAKCECPPCPKNVCEAVELAKKSLIKVVCLPKNLVTNCVDECKYGPKETRRYDYCRGCCDEETLKALAKVAYERDEFCCFVEPSLKVRLAAEEALLICPCTYVPPEVFYPGTEVLPEPQPLIPPVPEREREIPEDPNRRETPEIPLTTQQAPVIQRVSAQQPVGGLEALHGYCIVNLKSKKMEPAQAQYSSVYSQVTYYFASAEAKRQFDSSPAEYAPMFRGYDPVTLAETGEQSSGIYLRECGGRLFLFDSNENWTKFESNPEGYLRKLIEVAEFNRSRQVSQIGK